MRLIDADALVKDLTYDWCGKPLHGNRKTNYANIRASVIAQPTIDAVPVVRCKDCKYWDFGDCYRLELSHPDDFCSYGERRDEEK